MSSDTRDRVLRQSNNANFGREGHRLQATGHRIVLPTSHTIPVACSPWLVAHQPGTTHYRFAKALATKAPQSFDWGASDAARVQRQSQRQISR